MNEMRMIIASRLRPELPEKNSLMHYGVLGMKWGIRRYQPYGEGGYTPKDKVHLREIRQKDGDTILSGRNKFGGSRPIKLSDIVTKDISIPAGSTLYRITDRDEKQEGGMYCYFTKTDNIRYSKDEVEHYGDIKSTYQTTKEIKVPSYKNGFDAFMKTYINFSIGDKDAESFIKDNGFVDDTQKKQIYGKDQKVSDISYVGLYGLMFDRMLDKNTNGRKGYKEFKTQFIDELSKNGYNATLDVMDMTYFENPESYKMSEAPLYIFDRADVTKKTGMKEITVEDYDNADKFEEEPWVRNK